MIKISAGTAAVLGLTKVKIDAPPTTAYYMLGERCVHNCTFCAQGRESEAKGHFLSRVDWPSFSLVEAFGCLASAYTSGRLKRACLQVVQGKQTLEATRSAVREIKKRSPIPVCASARINNPEEAGTLLDSGVDKVCIALDAVTSQLYQVVKGADFYERINLLEVCARAYPGRISTHLIAGLGETESDMIQMIQRLADLQVIIALFAFTPLKGTPLAWRPQPPIEQYRRIQVANSLITSGQARLEDMHFQEGQLTAINLSGLVWWEIILAGKGKAFQTSGCPDCNRPYYNESPRGQIYNYPRPLTGEEVTLAIAQCALDGDAICGMVGE